MLLMMLLPCPQLQAKTTFSCTLGAFPEAPGAEEKPAAFPLLAMQQEFDCGVHSVIRIFQADQTSRFIAVIPETTGVSMQRSMRVFCHRIVA